MAASKPDPTDELVERIVARVQRQLQVQTVPPDPVVRGTWQDQTAMSLYGSSAGLRALLGAGACRLGSDGRPHSDGYDAELARTIDHTLLAPTATRKDLERVCDEALQYNFASVCVNSTWIGFVAEKLRGSPVMPICVVGFPLGAASTEAKAAETRLAVRDGAQEIDMVINIGALKGSEHERVFDDIRAVVEAAAGRPVKVILETSMLSREEKIAGSALSKAAGAAFVKTSTGFGGGGATADDIALMRAVVGPAMGVKASGGVRTTEDAQKMLAAGADRIGASASVAIVHGTPAGKQPAGKGAY